MNHAYHATRRRPALTARLFATLAFALVVWASILMPQDAQAQDVRLVAVNPENEWVTIKNFGSDTVDISDFWLCQRPQYDRIGESASVAIVSGDLVLEPMEEVVVNISPDGQSGNFNPITDLIANDELALLASASFGTTDPTVMLDFVTWGGVTASTRVGQAVTAGRWDDAERFATGAAPYTFLGTTADAGTDFWLGDTEIRMTHIVPANDLVVIENADDVALDLSGFFFCTQPGIYPHLGNPEEVEVVEGSLLLAPGERVAVRVVAEGGVLDGQGGLMLYSTNLLGFNNGNPAALRDYAQWGAEGLRVDKALMAGRWDDANAFIMGSAPYYVGDLAAGAFGSPVWQARTAAVRMIAINPANNRIRVKNFGTEEVDISGYWFCLEVGQYEQVTGADLVLSPDEEAVLDVATGLAETGADNIGLFSTNTFSSTSPDVYVDFAQWGGRDDGGRPDQAVLAGVWNDANAFIEGASPYRFTGDAASFGVAAWNPSNVANEAEETLPDGFALHGAYPNPFNPQTTIAYDLGQAVPVRLAVYDVLGREVRVLLDGVRQATGRHTFAFDGAALPSGTYLYRIEAGAFSATGSLVLLK
ncbi:MAG: T9SS type A sorting domain-containing protein [Bacteroidota bacterium]